MYQRLFLYSRNQIAIKNINILLDPTLSAKKKVTISYVLCQEYYFRFHEVVTLTVDGKGRGSCFKTEKQCNWTSNFFK